MREGIAGLTVHRSRRCIMGTMPSPVGVRKVVVPKSLPTHRLSELSPKRSPYCLHVYLRRKRTCETWNSNEKFLSKQPRIFLTLKVCRRGCYALSVTSPCRNSISIILDANFNRRFEIAVRNHSSSGTCSYWLSSSLFSHGNHRIRTVVFSRLRS